MPRTGSQAGVRVASSCSRRWSSLTPRFLAESAAARKGDHGDGEERQDGGCRASVRVRQPRRRAVAAAEGLRLFEQARGRAPVAVEQVSLVALLPQVLVDPTVAAGVAVRWRQAAPPQAAVV